MASDRFSPPSGLLLLPPPPSTSFEQLRDAYGPSLSDVFSKISRMLNGSNDIAVLDIALSIPGLLSPSYQPRAKVFKRLQSFLASIYSLIGIVSTEQRIELDFPGGVDARVVFIDFDPVHPALVVPENRQVSLYGPILDLQTLATSERSWDCVFYLDNKTGQSLAAAFSSLYSQTRDFTAGIMHPISGVSDWESSEPLLINEDELPSNTHFSVIVGGTFDHFHIGHKLLLTATALALEPTWSIDTGNERLLSVGVTGDELLVNKKYAEFLESWEERYQNTASFLAAILEFCPPEKTAPRIQRVSQPGPNGKYALVKLRPNLTLKIVQISDPFGPTITEENISALIVSQETRAGGAAVNDERAKKGWKSLDIFEVDVLHLGELPTADSDSFASKISSTDIRRRQMDQSTR
ncbi:hypothetical protein ASPWEDRAFT_23110 [Aspergillus wentii DTO 134E9]|uniref:Cytidyltransferase-like domain-containing protein n=1 Tax=Aspergillus wentii DTO 134E9 TaxID=1073089 RepID=A0A1L9S1F6_ASPWE|nr:uncharacterized protein ASPWEDRAFT_23110 [Aspergillus wentii DTO 134E9]KAI9931022.1 hypothetical protein MW887_010677 [Aspergillus wentii]OJJ40985.1 hypothetical protein ASPWEDRAFT_23110 [Aspergillus wentii DTO 134E9]